MKAFSRAPLARSPLTALLVLLVSLTLAAFGAVMTARYFHAETEARFEQRSRVIQDAISYGMNSYVNLLVHSAGVFVASRDVSREEFRNFVRSIQLRERYPGIQGIGYVPIVKAKELASHTRRAREAGLPDYEVRDFRNTQGNIALPRKPEDNRYPIYYLEPMDAENRLAIGMDFATERRRKVAMERARDSGQPAVTETILLVQDKNQPEGRQEPSFLIFYPVYEPGMPTATIEQRRRAVRGFVYSPYRAPEVFNAILRKSLSTGFEMDVETFNSPEPQVETLIYDSDTSRRWPEHPTHHLKVVQYEVGGRTWSSLITLAPGFESPAEDYAPWLIGLLGTLLSFLLFRLVRNLRVHSKAVEDALMLAALGHDRLEFLYQSTGSVYGSAPDHETVLHRLSEAIVPKLADWSSTVILSEAGETQVSSMVWRRQDKKFEDYFKRSFRPLPDASRRGVARVLATGQPEFIPFLEEEEYGNFTSVPGAIAALREIHPCSYICVPLKARQRTVGAFIAMMSDSGRHYTNDDLTLISEFAAKASAAVENSFLYHDLQKAIEARDDFISVASHELKTPLTTLKLQAQLLQRNLRQAVAEGVTLEQASAQLRKAAEISERQVSRLTRLVDDMLEVSRIRGGKLRFKKEELDLVGLVKEVLDRSAELVSDAGCSLRLREYGPVRGAWDRFRVEQVVLNLLSNAAKYGAGKPIELTVRREDAFAILEVRDHGVGISPADQERIFHRFERATSTQEISGLGLGLFISRQIVEGQGGRIELRSTPGEGSTFIVKLPIDPQLPARPPARTDQPLVLD